MAITSEKFGRFTALHIKENVCQECGNGEWIVQAENPEEGGESKLLKLTLPDVAISRYLAVYVTSCAVCGFMKTYNCAPIDAWAAENE